MGIVIVPQLRYLLSKFLNSKTTFTIHLLLSPLGCCTAESPSPEHLGSACRDGWQHIAPCHNGINLLPFLELHCDYTGPRGISQLQRFPGFTTVHLRSSAAMASYILHYLAAGFRHQRLLPGVFLPPIGPCDRLHRTGQSLRNRGQQPAVRKAKRKLWSRTRKQPAECSVPCETGGGIESFLHQRGRRSGRRLRIEEKEEGSPEFEVDD